MILVVGWAGWQAVRAWRAWSSVERIPFQVSDAREALGTVVTAAVDGGRANGGDTAGEDETPGDAADRHHHPHLAAPGARVPPGVPGDRQRLPAPAGHLEPGRRHPPGDPPRRRRRPGDGLHPPRPLPAQSLHRRPRPGSTPPSTGAARPPPAPSCSPWPSRTSPGCRSTTSPSSTSKGSRPSSTGWAGWRSASTTPSATPRPTLHLYLPAGCTVADGPMTLSWVRSRHTRELVDGVWRRMEGVNDLARTSASKSCCSRRSGA